MLFMAGIVMIFLGIFQLQFKGMGPILVFFGLLGLLSLRDMLMTKEKAMNKETKLKMHRIAPTILGVMYSRYMKRKYKVA